MKRAVERTNKDLRKKVKLLETEIEDTSKMLEELAYDTAFSKSIQDKMNNLPEGWLGKSYHVNLIIEGTNEVIRVSFGLERLCPDRYKGYSPSIVKKISSNCRYLSIKKSLKTKRSEFNNLKKELRVLDSAIAVKVRAVVTSVSTTGRLLKIWPEAEQLLPAGSTIKPNTMLPAIVLADLNAELGLNEKRTV